ncbi:restriction endonuclease subunit S [Streptococcus suis]|nr:restriction endonuclease subunit S [Streptococcus suis]
MPNKEKNIPKRRFKEFENADAWELRKLGEVAEIITGTTPSTFDEENYGGKRLFVSPVDIQDNRYITETLTTLTEKGHLLGRELRPGATLFVSIGSTIGKVAQLKAFATSNQQINAVISDDKIDDDFIFTGLEKKSTQIKNLSSQQAVPIINKSTFSKIEFEFPTLPEQKAIGTFFSILDQQITLHQRKLDKLKSVKQAYLSEMFPAEGERVPKRRFPGFTDDWELRKLGEVGTVAMCRRIFKEQTSEHGEIPFYKIGTFGGTPDAFIARELFEEFKDKYSYPNIGDILISASGSIGRTVEFLGEDEYFQDSNIVWLKHDGKINNIFLKQFYSIVKWSGIEGSTIKRLYNENILNTEISLPTLPEQKVIGTFFSTLDQYITLHQRKLEKLKNLKKALLNELFV